MHKKGYCKMSNNNNMNIPSHNYLLFIEFEHKLMVHISVIKGMKFNSSDEFS